MISHCSWRGGGIPSCLPAEFCQSRGLLWEGGEGKDRREEERQGGIKWRGGDLQREKLLLLKHNYIGSISEGNRPAPNSRKAGFSAVRRIMVYLLLTNTTPSSPLLWARMAFLTVLCVFASAAFCHSQTLAREAGRGVTPVASVLTCLCNTDRRWCRFNSVARVCSRCSQVSPGQALPSALSCQYFVQGTEENGSTFSMASEKKRSST